MFFLLSSITESVLLLAGLGAVPLVGFWFWRSLRDSLHGGNRPERTRFRWELGFLLLVPGLQLALRLPDRAARNLSDWLWLAFWGALALWQLSRLLGQWRKARQERLGLSSRGPDAAPSVRAQLMLILLPVLGLAAVGMISLARDKVAVEEDARRRAEEAAQELAAKLSQTVPGELTGVEMSGIRWMGAGTSSPEALGDDPAVVPVPLQFAGAPETEWDARYPIRAGDVLPVAIRLGPDGLLKDPAGFPPVPRPNPWSQRLSDEAGKTWQALLAADSDAVSPARFLGLARAFSRTTSDLAPSYQATFLELRREQDLPPTEIRGRLLGFAHSAAQQQVEAESGIPIGLVAVAEALRRNPEANLTREWGEVFRALTFSQPSSLTPWLLDRGDEMARRSGETNHAGWMRELRARWDSSERRRGLAQRLRSSIALSAELVTNRWLNQDGHNWLAVVQPASSSSWTSQNGWLVTNTFPELAVRLFRAELLGWAFHHAGEAGRVSNGREQPSAPRLPAGLKFGIECVGRELTLPKSPWAVAGTERESRVLASASGELRQAAAMAGSGAKFDNWPSRPHFTVRVHLADATALFAAQRRQQWLFGGMILVTAGVAGLGAWQTNRTFRRQLALNEEQSNFVSSVSHELRAPLASLRLLAEGLAEGRVQDDAKRREYAGFLVQETRRLGALVENVLDFARIEQGRKQYQFEPTDLVRLVTETTRLMEPLAAERQVRLALKLPVAVAGVGDRFEIKCDGPALQQALVNLLDNALKHAPADSAVTVALEGVAREGSADGPVRQQAETVGKAGSQGELADEGVCAPLGWVRLSVSDAGPGIPPEDHERIFERFFRRGSELRRETQGVGLGLAIVKHIVAAHRGRVWVESQPGQGARFVVELPLDGGETE